MSRLVDFIKIIRFPNLAIIALTQYAIRFGVVYPLFALLVLSTLMIAAAGYIINDYFDVKLDYLNRPKQLVVGKSISRRQAMFLHLVINLIGLLLAVYVALKIDHPMLFLFQLVSAALLWFYSVSFKRQALVGNLVIAALTALVPFISGYYEVALMFDHIRGMEATNPEATLFRELGKLLFSIQYLLYWVVGYSAFAFLLSLAREIIKDCEDIEGDRTFNCKTFPIVYGISKAKKLSAYLLLLTFFFILMIQIMQYLSKDWVSLLYFGLLLNIPLLWLAYKTFKAQKKKDFFILSQSIKFVMLFGILYTIIIHQF